jgi:GrpB-like predicted nucleotidyltransferase (UPF0157 family)
MNIGLKENTLRLANHNSKWKELFSNEKLKLENIIGNYIITIDHIGSTSINGIKAKPIIDICIGLNNFDDGKKCIEPLVNIGYIYKGECGVPGRLFFKTNDEIVTHHIHMFKYKSDKWKKHIYFRDYLNKYPLIAKEYESLKIKLLKLYINDREKYTDGKADFINEIIKKAYNEYD